VPQGSVLGPILFVCYINCMPESVSSFLYMYADDTKVFRRVDVDGATGELQMDLDRLVEWSEKWQLHFNVEKCKIMHIGGSRNERAGYRMATKELKETTEEKDLGVWLDNTVKSSCHVNHAGSKANQLLGLIRRTFTYMDAALMKQLFTSVVRPHLGYANVVWHPHLKRI
jgi:ribonucleases P/MRP protein subunit RPP40